MSSLVRAQGGLNSRKVRAMRSVLPLLFLVLAVALLGPASADAGWDSVSKCSAGENHHCYAQSERDILRFGGVLASIDFVDSTSVNVTSEAFVSNEQWVSFEDQGYTGWIEDGQLAGPNYYYAKSCCEMHPFYAEQQRGKFQLNMSSGTFPLNSYNHYVIFDAEVNGSWHIYWGCCEVGHYGGGWPEYLSEQAAGIEAATEARPYEWGKQEVWASDGGAWSEWNFIEYARDPGICMQQNTEAPTAEGDIMWGTLGSPPDEECN